MGSADSILLVFILFTEFIGKSKRVSFLGTENAEIGGEGIGFL